MHLKSVRAHLYDIGNYIQLLVPAVVSFPAYPTRPAIQGTGGDCLPSPQIVRKQDSWPEEKQRGLGKNGPSLPQEAPRQTRIDILCPVPV